MKIALQTGAALVPTFTFGETDTVTVVDTRKVAWARRVQRAAKALGGFTLPLCVRQRPVWAQVRAPPAPRPHLLRRGAAHRGAQVHRWAVLGFKVSGLQCSFGSGCCRTACPSPCGPLLCPTTQVGQPCCAQAAMGRW